MSEREGARQVLGKLKTLIAVAVAIGGTALFTLYVLPWLQPWMQEHAPTAVDIYNMMFSWADSLPQVTNKFAYSILALAVFIMGSLAGIEAWFYRRKLGKTMANKLEAVIPGQIENVTTTAEQTVSTAATDVVSALRKMGKSDAQIAEFLKKEG